MRKLLKSPLFLIYICAIVFIVIVMLIVPSYKSADDNGSVAQITEGWTEITDDGDELPFTQFGEKINKDHLTISFDMSNLEDDQYAIGFYTYYCAVDVSVDGEPVYSYGDNIDLKNRVMIGNYYAMVDIHGRNGRGNTLRMDFKGDKNITVYPVDFGRGSTLEMNMISGYIPTLITLVLAVVLILLTLFVWNKDSTRNMITRGQVWFIIFAIHVAVWQMADSQFLMDIGMNAGTVCLLSFEVYMLLPVTLLMFLYHECHNNQDMDRAFSFIAIGNFVVLNFFNFAGLMNFLDSLISTHICVGGTMILALVQVIIEYVRNRDFKSKILLTGFSIFFASVLVQYLGFIQNPSGSNSTVLRLGTDAFIILQAFIIIQDANERIELVSAKLKHRDIILKKTFGMLFPDDMVESIMDDPEKVRVSGESRQLTVLQSDIRGFSELIQPITASDAIEMLNHYLEVMTAVIRRHGGTVVEFQGDGILAVFDSRNLESRHADRAIFAAVEMQNCMPDIASWNMERSYPVFEMGIGINSGPAYVGWIGSKERMEYNAIGTTVNIASRIEGYSTGGQILISELSRTMLTVRPDIRETFKVLPKGFQKRIKVHAVGGILEPYNLYCVNNEFIPKKLTKPIEIYFRTVQDKQCSDERYTGMITALSVNSAILITGTGLGIFDDLRIEAGETFSAKVVSQYDEGFLIRFTSASSGDRLSGTFSESDTGREL